MLDDFGGQGQPPSHPQLLDNLAIEFAETGWDVKHLLRLIATSRAYRQSSAASAEALEVDPSNELIARQGRFRLPAEMIRDTALSTSGLLINRLGGPSARPYQPKGYYSHLNFPIRTYQHDTDSAQWRRGLYVHWQRQYLHPMLKAFDAPSREECTAKRPESSTPLASLTLLNDPTFVEAARVFAANVLRDEPSDPNARINAIYLRAVGRPADEVERAKLAGFVDAQLAHYQEHADEAIELLAVGLSKPDSHADKAELAAWTFACRAVLNLGETLTRN